MSSKASNNDNLLEDQATRVMILMSLASFLMKAWQGIRTELWSRIKTMGLRRQKLYSDGARLGFIHGYVHGFFGQTYDNGGREGRSRTYTEAYLDFYDRGHEIGRENSQKHFRNIRTPECRSLFSLLTVGMDKGD